MAVEITYTFNGKQHEITFNKVMASEFVFTNKTLYGEIFQIVKFENKQ